MPSLTIPWTVSLIGKTLGTNAAGKKLGFVAEFDAELTINYWGELKYKEAGWELDSIAVEWSTPSQRHIITEESDPALWEIILRDFQNNMALDDKIIEAIGEDMEGSAADRAYEEYRDRAMEYDLWKAGR